jgi:hypothetical protein
MAAMRWLALVVVATAACSPGTAATTTSSIPTTSTGLGSTTTPTTVPPNTSTVVATTTPPPEQTVQVLLQPFSELGPEWVELFLAYGEGEEELGTAPGGDGLMLGPEYGTIGADGYWWILDAAKMRVARFRTDGRFVDQIPFAEEILVAGQYFQYQMPQALANGPIVATGFQSETESSLLEIVDTSFSATTFEPAGSWVTTDGTFLYGGDFDGQLYRVQPEDPSSTVAPVDHFQTWGGGPRYSAVIIEGDIVVDLPDLGVTRTMQLRYSADPTVSVFGGIEVETGVDGTIFILIYGAPESEESVGVGGFLSISPQGVVSEVEPMRDPFSPADPGSPAHLGVTPNTATPWLMFIDEDGVRIYAREDKTG